VLVGKVAFDDVVQETDRPRLSLLRRGAAVPNPGELFLGRAADRFLKEVYDRYDYIVVDSPPVMAADDSTSLAPKIDATLFVFRFTHSSSRVSRKAIDLLRDRQANVLGVICNDVDEAMQEYYYYRYPEYYGHRGAASRAG
jgi:Mrp family chromosome partitioning ATPase